MSRMGIGIQLYTLRNETAQDFKGTLRQVAALGYEGVEFAGYGGLAPQELKELLGELKLTSVGSHVSVERLRDHLQEEIEMSTTIGSQYVVCPYLSEEMRKSPENIAELIELFKHASRQFAASGIRFGYHNHDFELKEKIGEQLLMDVLFNSTTPEEMFCELDACWVHAAGFDPVAYIGKYEGRLPLLHLKDTKKHSDGSIETVELGAGDIDLPGVIAAAGAAGTQWLIVEQDNCKGSALDSIAISMNWLKDNYL